jgi:hypothetical protein
MPNYPYLTPGCYCGKSWLEKQHTELSKSRRARELDVRRWMDTPEYIMMLSEAQRMRAPTPNTAAIGYRRLSRPWRYLLPLPKHLNNPN